jgi:5'-phosphate synthase pdxT subunit
MDRAVVAAYRGGMRLWGTCAGAILLATEIEGELPHLALLDITIRRNAFGSQLDSFNCTACIPEIAEEPLPLTFIRAPVILRAGAGVHVLLRVRDSIAAAESDTILVSTFHPELTPGVAVHAYFARKCGLVPQRVAPADAWHRVEWLRFTQPQSPADSGR